MRTYVDKIYKLTVAVAFVVAAFFIGLAFGYKDAEKHLKADRKAPEARQAVCFEEPEEETQESADSDNYNFVETANLQTAVPAVPVVLEPAEPEEKPSYSERDLYCLACAIYQEAGMDACSDTARFMVGDVVLNRVAHDGFPNTIEEVLTQYQQYGRFYWTGVVWPSRASTEAEAHAVARAYDIAERILNGEHSELYGNGYIWQAEFVQGTSGFWKDGIYFAK